MGVEHPHERDGNRSAEELREHKAEDRGGRDARESVGEHPADADRRIGKAGRAREEVGGSDVRADAGGGHRRASGPREREDHE